MTGRIKFTVYGEPKGKSRPRFSNRCGHAVAYKPMNDVQYESLIRNEFIAVAKDWEKVLQPVGIKINAVQGISKSVSKKQRERILSGLVVQTKKPDLDNIVKIVMDALNGLAWQDDKQVIEINAEKSAGQDARVEIQIFTLEGLME